MTHKEEEITEYQIPNGVSMIGENAFTSARIGTFVIPDSVVAIGKNAIDAYYYNKSYQQKNVTIKGYSGSCAETYAREHEIEFVSLGTTRQTGAPNVPAPLVLSLGDLNGDREINASDGAVILIGSAHTGGACAVLLLGCVCFWKSGAGRKKRTEEPSVF